MFTDYGERKQWFAQVCWHLQESDKKWGVAISLAFFLGLSGADRFYLGSKKLGVAKLCTLGGFGIWWISDIVLLLADKMRDFDKRRVKRPF